MCTSCIDMDFAIAFKLGVDNVDRRTFFTWLNSRFGVKSDEVLMREDSCANDLYNDFIVEYHKGKASRS